MHITYYIVTDGGRVHAVDPFVRTLISIILPYSRLCLSTSFHYFVPHLFYKIRYAVAYQELDYSVTARRMFVQVSMYGWISTWAI